MTTSATLSPVTGPAAWRGDELLTLKNWIYHLSEAQIAELETLGHRFVEDDPDLRFVKAADYPVDACAHAIDAWCQ
ncbi:taurine dioxygenase, partial [Paraburkholderia sp. SIMBA_009]